MRFVCAVVRTFVVFFCPLLLLPTFSEAILAQSCTVSVTPSSGQAPLAVSVTATCPPTNGVSPFASAKADFGDGNFSLSLTNPSFSHTYDRDGSFTVSVVATYSDNSTIPGTAQNPVTVSPITPGPPAVQGDIYISGTAGTIERRTSSGTLAQVLYIGHNDQIGGMAFGGAGRLFVTDSSSQPSSASVNDLYFFDFLGNPQTYGTQSTPASSVAFDRSGDIFTGGSTGLQGGPLLEKYPLGNEPPIQQTPDVSGTFAKWIDVAFDGCTLYYSLGSNSILQSNICTGQDFGNFVSGLPGGNANEFRIRPDGTFVIANDRLITVLDNAGGVLNKFGANDSSSFNALSLDPDNKTVWVGDRTGKVFHYDIQSGQLLGQFSSNFDSVNGLAVIGELRVATVAPPVCTLNVSPKSGLAPLPVTASGSCTSQTGAIQSYTLDFGDGFILPDKPSGTHTYTAPGQYSPNITGTDRYGQTGFAPQNVTVTSPVTCSFNVDPSSGASPLTVSANGACSSSNSTIDPATYSIDWGDQTTTGASSGPHTYQGAGSFAASISAKDANGQTGQQSLTVVVTNPTDPSCTISASPEVGTGPLTVTVNVVCTAGFLSGSVDFGDGFTQSLTSPFSVPHVYEGSRTFTIQAFASYSQLPTFAYQNVNVSLAQPTSPPAIGDVYVSGASGIVERRDSKGNLLQVLDTLNRRGLGKMVFDPAKNLYVSLNTFNPETVKFDPSGNLSPFSANHLVADTVAFNQAGNLYVGGNQGEGGTVISKLDAAGNELQQFFPDSDTFNGVLGMDLAADQCTMYYTTGGTQIKRYDVCADAQLKDFNEGKPLSNPQTDPSAQAWDVRLLPNGQVLAADFTHVFLLDANANIVQTYGRPVGANSYVGLSLDPDGTTFWATQRDTGEVLHLVIEPPGLQNKFTVNFPSPHGVTVLGEIRVATNPGPTCTLTVIPTAGAAPLTVNANGSCNNSSLDTLDFGDGTVLDDTSSGSHTYPNPGTFTVKLTGTLNGTSNVVTQVVTVGPANQPPTCSLSIAPTSGVAPLTVNVTANCSDSDGSVSNASIDWGDGTAATQLICDGSCFFNNGTHTYASSGTFTATLTAIDNGGASSQPVTQTITVTPVQPPACTLNVVPNSGPAPLTVVATGNCTAGTNPIASSTIDFGDGSGPQSGTSGTHTYNSPGTFTVTVTAKDTNGLSGSTTQTVTVGPAQAPACTLSVIPNGGAAPLNVTATGNCTPGSRPIASTTLDFGDGSGTQSGTSGTHKYTTAGTFTVKLTATDTSGLSSTTTQTVTVTPAVAPACTLTVVPNSGPAPLDVTATGNCTAGTSPITSTSLDFGDGSASQTGTSGTHRYGSAGTFTVKVTATDSNGLSGSATQTVTVAVNQPPSCTLSVAPTSGLAPLPVTATGSCTDPEKALSSTLLDFGDGTTQAASSGTHTYTIAGMFTVTLTGTDAVGQKATATQTVTVGTNTAPTCTLTVTPTTGIVPLPITATGNCVDAENNITATVLDFGDGTTANAASGTHTYNTAGSFTVKVTATDALGLSGFASQTVTVTVNNFPPGLFVGISPGTVKRFAPDGTLLQTLTTGLNGTVSGMGFDKAGNLYATDFTAGNVSKFDPKTGTLVGTFGTGFNCQPETIVFDGAGNAYVGQQGCSRQILKFDPSGKLVTTFTVATEEQGSDDIDLSADNCTLLYTSEGQSILRYDVCRNQQMAPFATGLKKALMLRILPDGGVIVGDLIDIVRLNASGQQVMTYTAPGDQCLYSITLDQDGTSFWAGDYCSSNIYRFDINSGKQLAKFNSGTPSGTVFGVAISGSGLNVAGLGNAGNIATSPSSATLASGQSATFTVSFTPNAASAGHTLTLSCAGLPAGLACSFNPPTITLGAVGATTTSTLTITRTTTAELLHPTSPWMLASWMGMVPAIVLVGLRSPRRRRGSMMWLGLIVACTGIWASCGGGGMSKSTTPAPTPQGTYTIIVVGNSGGMQASTTVNLTVQ